MRTIIIVFVFLASGPALAKGCGCPDSGTGAHGMPQTEWVAFHSGGGRYEGPPVRDVPHVNHRMEGDRNRSRPLQVMVGSTLRK